ncbi:hypothetical protein D3C78_1566660 [compost metagenome]
MFGEAGPGHGRKQQALLLAVVALVDELAEEAEELGQVAGRQFVALRPLGHAFENPQGGEDGVMLVGEIADDLAHGTLRSKGRLSRQSRGPLRLVQPGCRGRARRPWRASGGRPSDDLHGSARQSSYTCKPLLRRGAAVRRLP